MKVTVSRVISLDDDLLDEIDGEAGASGNPGTGKTVQA
jgi:hypothetical protein